jgi:hypothetical protein
MTPSARIVQISVSSGGVPKRPVPQALQAEGHPITPGSIGENLTIEGIDWNAVRPGAYLRLGEDVVAQVTRYTAPCVNPRRFVTGSTHASPRRVIRETAACMRGCSGRAF